MDPHWILLNVQAFCEAAYNLQRFSDVGLHLLRALVVFAWARLGPISVFCRCFALRFVVVGYHFVSGPLSFHVFDFSSERFDFSVSGVPRVSAASGVPFLFPVLSGTILSKRRVVLLVGVVLPDVSLGVSLSQ